MTQLLTRTVAGANPTTAPSRYQAYTLTNLRRLPQYELLDEEQRRAIEVVGRVLPFKTNNYVVSELIDREAVPADPIFTRTFP